MDALQKDKHYTYADYVTWGDEIRYELIDGVAYMLSAPAWEHQDISMSLSYQIRGFLKGKPCKVFAAPFDVRLNADGGDDTVVQPDLVVVCDRSKLIGTGCVGAPDVVIEILSPSTSARDKVQKFNKYLQVGVREYWIVYPDSKTVSVHTLADSHYVTMEYGVSDTAVSRVLEGCSVILEDVFTE